MEVEFLRSMLDALSDKFALMLAFVFFSSCMQQLFPPYPGDSVMLLCGLISGRQWRLALPLYAVFLCATLLSSAFVYELGARKGTKVLKGTLAQKWFPPEKQISTIEKLRKYRVSAYLLCKFLPGCNSVALLLGGAGGMARKEVYFAAGMAAFLHNTLFFLLGRKMSDNSSHIARVLRSMNVASLAVLAFIVAIYFILKKMKKR